MNIKGSTITKLALGLMIAASVAACKQAPTASTSSTTATSAAVQPIVYINEDSLLVKYNYIKDMNKRLEDKGKAASGDVESRRQAIQREAAEYQRNANTMTTDQRQATEQRLGQKGQEFQQYQQNESTEFQNFKNDESSKLYDKIAAFTKAYAKEKGYKMVLTYAKGGATLLYADPSLDVTADVLKRLNDEYAKEKK